MPEAYGRWPAVALARAIADRTVSPVEVVDAVLADIAARGSRTNAFLSVLYDRARDEARAAECRVQTGESLGPLHGVPIAIKDLYADKAGARSTAGSRIFADRVATTTTPYVGMLERAGAIVVATTNTPEFGYKATTDNALIGPTRNPWNLELNAGGSSGGSAAAVADGLLPLAQGSDGGGSIRIPAAMCGVLGMKATFGLVPMVGRPDGFNLHTPYAHAGPLARNAADAAAMLNAMTGWHPRDPFAVPRRALDWADTLDGDLRGLRIAYSPDLGGFPVQSDVRAVIESSIRRLEEAGATVIPTEVRWPAPPYELSMLWRRQSAVRNLETIESYRRAGLVDGPDDDRLTEGFREVLELGRSVGLLDYRMDDVLRTRCFDVVEDVFETADVLVSPVLSVSGVPNSDTGDTFGPTEVDGQPVDPCIGWCLTFPFNFTPHPAASVPAGCTPAGVPVGLQPVAPRFHDQRVLNVARALETDSTATWPSV
ncbi:MAG: amidase [Nocardioidaceae bacterium]